MRVEHLPVEDELSGVLDGLGHVEDVLEVLPGRGQLRVAQRLLAHGRQGADEVGQVA